MSHKSQFYFAVFVFFVIFILHFFISPPRNFPDGIIFSISNGDSLRTVSFNLKQKNLINSRLVFEALVIMRGGDKHIIFADYLFENKINVFEVAGRISKGERHLAPIKVTVPEGFNVYEIAELFSSKLSVFEKDKFLNLAKDHEGYLFPDTYFFFTDAKYTDVFKAMNTNFNKKIISLQNDIKKSGKTEDQIIKMASIVEKESKGDVDREMISGILWKRFAIGMALQADAAPETYKNKGLPQKPISNPGLASIRSTISPKSSAYLYYLHDKNGGIHYAKTFSEHRANIVKYLK